MNNKTRVAILLSIALVGGCATQVSQESEARISAQNAKIRQAIEASEQAQRIAEQAMAEAQLSREAAYQADERALRMLDRASKK